MNSSKYQAVVTHLTPEEQELLLQFGHVANVDGMTVAMDMDIRRGLARALGDMGSAVQQLLTKLNGSEVADHRRTMPSYEELLAGIAIAAANGAAWVNRSHEFDQSALLAVTAQPTAWLQ